MTDLRNEPVQRRSTSRLESLRAAGRLVYHRDGRDRLTSAAVAAEAGCSIGTFYRYFEDRVALLDDLHPNRDAGAINILLARLPDDGGPVWQFVEIENDEGASIGVGEWADYPIACPTCGTGMAAGEYADATGMECGNCGRFDEGARYSRIRITTAGITEALDRPRETKEATAA